MTVCVVVGMHASGTSLVTHCLLKMGIYMGEQFTGPVKNMPTWEDKLFFTLNVSLLTRARGNWSRPPSSERIAEAGLRTEYGAPPIIKLMKTLVQVRERPGRPWGWKDPRTCLTVHVWHPLLTKPRYICTRRDHDAIARSILERGPSRMSHREWIDLARDYDMRVEAFLGAEKPRFHVQFEDLVHRSKADQVLEGLARFLGVKNKAVAVERALEVIKFR